MQLAVIGAGTMGLMSAARLVESGLCSVGDVCLSDASRERRAWIEGVLPGAQLVDDNAAAVAGADVVIIAVKPPHFADVGAGLSGHVSDDALVVSVMTAIDLATMLNALDVNNVVRVSTNIGIQAGVATTFWIASSEASDSSVELARSVFSAWGDQFECPAEALLDVAMVGVGSGPALVLEFARAMTEAMEANGMPRRMAEQGILSLLRGTAELVRGSDRSPADFQKSVVTPGGITAEALQAMAEDKFRDIVVNAFQKALDKTARLTEPNKN